MASIEKRGEFSYRLTASCGYNKAGRKIVKRKTISVDPGLTEKQLQKELQHQLAIFQDAVEKGTYLDAGRMTFEEFIAQWLTDHAEKQLAPKTVHRYREMLTSRIIPAMGHLRLNKIQPMHLTAFYNNLAEDGIRMDGKPGGLSNRTILHHHRLLSSILTAAVQWQLILDNPARRVKPPKVEKTEAKHYDEEQTEAVLVLLKKEPLKYQVMINLVIFTGIRLGELAGLTWADVDFEQSCLRTKNARQYLPGVGSYDKEPKWQSERVISLPQIVLGLLREHKLQQTRERLLMGERWQDHDRVFAQANGKPIFPGTPSAWFAKFLKKYDLPELTFHQLRHTNATLLIAQGVDVKTVSNRLGHARTSTTMDIYSHALQRPDKEAAEKLDALFTK